MELKDLIEKMNSEFAAFKADNDRRLKEIEAKGNKDPLTEEKIQKHSEALGEMQKQIDEVQLKVQRKGAGGGGDELEKNKLAHRKAFANYIRKGVDVGLSELEQKATNVVTNNDTQGGYAVPDTLDSAIEKYERDNVPMRSVCSQMTVSNENYEKLVQQGTAGSGWVDELESRPETDAPTLAALKPYFGEVYASPAASQKALDDMAFDVEAWLGDEVGMKMSEDENEAFTLGSGVKKPKGILAYTLSTSVDGTRAFGSIQKVGSGSSGAFVADKILDLIHALKRGYRQNAIMMMSALSVAAMRKLKDGQNNYLWQPSYVAGQPQVLAGYPIVENDDMADPGAGSLSLMFGDFKRAYTVYDVRGVRVLRDPFTAKPKVLFYSTKRVGGMVVNDRAVKVMELT